MRILWQSVGCGVPSGLLHRTGPIPADHCGDKTTDPRPLRLGHVTYFINISLQSNFISIKHPTADFANHIMGIKLSFFSFFITLVSELNLVAYTAIKKLHKGVCWTFCFYLSPCRFKHSLILYFKWFCGRLYLSWIIVPKHLVKLLNK